MQRNGNLLLLSNLKLKTEPLRKRPRQIACRGRFFIGDEVSIDTKRTQIDEALYGIGTDTQHGAMHER